MSQRDWQVDDTLSTHNHEIRGYSEGTSIDRYEGEWKDGKKEGWGVFHKEVRARCPDGWSPNAVGQRDPCPLHNPARPLRTGACTRATSTMTDITALER